MIPHYRNATGASHRWRAVAGAFRSLRQRSVLLGFILFVLAMSWTRPLLAAHDGTESPAPDDSRLDALIGAMNAESRRDQIWLWGWGSAFGAATAVQLGLLPFADNEGDRAELIVGAASSAIGLAGYWIVPARTIRDASSLTRRRETASDAQERALLLEHAEAAFKRNADLERQSRGIVAHGINAVINLAAGAVLGFGYDRWTSAAITAGGGLLVGEIVILTQPKHLMDEEKSYFSAENFTPLLAEKAYGLNWHFRF